MGSRIAAGSVISADFLNQEYTDSDGNNTTVTGTVFANLSSAYTIPASDAAVGTIYRLTCWGNGTWGSTQQKLTLGIALAGTVIGTQPSVASTAFSASAAFDFELCLILQCLSTGASGTWSAMLRGCLSESANNLLPGTAADNTVPLTGSTHSDAIQDTTVSNTLAVQAKWAATTGAPTITCVSTMRERLD